MYLPKWSKSETLTPPSAGKDVKQEELLLIASGNASETDTLGVWQTPKTKLLLLLLLSLSSHHAPWSLSKGLEKWCLHRNLHMDIYSSFIHNCQTWKHPRCTSVGEWINQLWSIQTMEYYSVLKKHELSSQDMEKCYKHMTRWKKLFWKVWLQHYDILEKTKP